MAKLKTKLARFFMIALLAFGLWQVPTSAWLSLWDWAMERAAGLWNWLLDMGRLMVLAK